LSAEKAEKQGPLAQGTKFQKGASKAAMTKGKKDEARTEETASTGDIFDGLFS
jgi:hypothetical protein